MISSKMTNNWFKNNKLKCVILCAGRGKRIIPFSEEVPKVMITIKNKPALGFIIDYWKKYTKNFVFVVGYKKEQVMDYVRTLPINSEFVEQKHLKGIADAISYVENLVSDQFIVLLGDCVYNGTFNFPDELQQGVGVQKVDNPEYIKLNYSIKITDDIITQVVEKPKKIINDLCGMGVYFFNKKVFDYIKNTPASSLRNEIEITDVIENMIKSGEEIKPIFFKGEYLNITYPEDIKKAEKFIIE
jgi:glucose-1-phosphate thymidylyltransferase